MKSYKHITIALLCATLLSASQALAETTTPTDKPAIDSAVESKKGVELKKAPDAIYALFGEELKNAKKEDISVNTLTNKVIGVYFSAHWCPPCRAFTPRLVEFHNALTKKGKSFEIVFVSFDRSKDAMYEYMKETKMPWLALKFDDKHKDALAKKYSVKGIPTLVILNSKGELISGNSRITGGDTAIYDKWAEGKEK